MISIPTLRKRRTGTLERLLSMPLGGIFLPREQLPDVLRMISDWLPLSHAIDALQAVAADSQDAAYIGGELLIIGAWIVGAVVLGSVTLRRRTP
ncbi:ABC transporter permease [Cryobacterium sp. TMS1-20-1]|uniref:ABC transporter permease n=1 Tax=Cryobacterium sp. TMS1-20-1 TaxID=1259223 RepID=UPI00141AFD74|nr:ABC transporter permease [Cryobacterium sp. TMS1-20-1]